MSGRLQKQRRNHERVAYHRPLPPPQAAAAALFESSELSPTEDGDRRHVGIISTALNAMIIYYQIACGWNASMSIACTHRPVRRYRFAGQPRPVAPLVTCVRKRGWRCKKIFRESRLSKVLARIKAVCPQFINIAELKERLSARDHHRLSLKLALDLHFFFEINLTLV